MKILCEFKFNKRYKSGEVLNLIKVRKQKLSKEIKWIKELKWSKEIKYGTELKLIKNLVQVLHLIILQGAVQHNKPVYA